MTERELSRRRVLRVSGITLAGGAVAGCSAAPGSGSETPESGGGDGADSNGGDGDSGSTPTDSSGDGSGGDGGQWTQTSTVEMTDKLKFVPKRVQVSTGTTVTWKNTGNIGHTVTAYESEIPDGAAYFASGGFESQSAAKEGYNNGKGNVPGGESYEHTFETTGTYKYYCIPHEMNGMVGFVKVV